MYNFQKLTKKQKEVYELYYNLGLSISSIAKRRQVTYNSIKKIILKLKEKGWIEKSFKQGAKKTMPSIMGGGQKYYRYHNLHLVIYPYYFYKRYNDISKGFGIPYGKWTVTFNKRNIEIQLKEKESFDSLDIEDCRKQAQEEVNSTIYKLSERYGFEVFKEGKVNIKLVNQHMAEVENGISKLVSQKFEIIGKDSKVWLLIDKSTGFKELETVHSELCPDDMKLLEKYLNDWRNNTPPTNSELSMAIMNSLKLQGVYNENIKKHLSVLENMDISLRELTNFIKTNTKPIQPSNLYNKLVSAIKSKDDIYLYLSWIAKLQPFEKEMLGKYFLGLDK